MLEVHVRGPGPGRSSSWRMLVLLIGLAFAAAGLSVILWPALIAYAVGGSLCALGVFLVVTALAARGL